jgi:hypothetical protein
MRVTTLDECALGMRTKRLAIGHGGQLSKKQRQMFGK